MTRVLHVFGAMDVGGAEMRTLDLMRDLGPKGVEFHFLTLSGRRGVLADEIESMGGHVHPIPLNRRFVGSYLTLLRQVRPDVVDSHVATFSGALLLGARVARVPVRVAHFRSDGDGHLDSVRRRLQRRVMRALIRACATDIVGVSPSALTDGYSPLWDQDPRARVIVNGVRSSPSTDSLEDALRVELGISNRAVIVMHVGRPSPEKNRPRAVAVLRAMCSTGVDAHLVLVGGEGVDSAEVATSIADMDLKERVHHLGSRRDIQNLMNQANVVLLPSTREGLPGVVLEALAVGTPVVATDLPGVRFIAEQIPGVRSVALSEPDSAWAAVVSQQIAEGRDNDHRGMIRSAFATSSFSQERASSNHHRLYQGTT